MSLLPLFNKPPTQSTLSSSTNLNRTNIIFAFLSILTICSVSFNVLSYYSYLYYRDFNKVVIYDGCYDGTDDYNYQYHNNSEEHLTQKFLPNVSFPNLKDLIIVAGHAIYLGNINQEGDEEKDENWVLEDYQKGGQVKTFIDHIKKGVELVKESDEALLVFSGGQTRPIAGPRSEAQSYYILAQSLNPNLFKNNTNITTTANSTQYPLITRIITEEYARDSYENLLFSICRFNEYTNNYPRNITVVGFRFKKKRFIELHRFSLKFPLDRFKYIGIDPDNTSPLGRLVGENINSLGPFKQDLYGCHGKLLDKKLIRNPYRRSHPYQISCPELSSLLNYCPDDPTQLFPDKLPWEE